MQAKIIKRTVDAATAEDGWIWDTEVKGFGLRIVSNNRKVYVVEYRPGGGGRGAQKRRLTIGQHGSPWTPDKAREEAKRILGMVADGDDPAAEKTANRKSMTMAALCDLYLAEGCANKKASTISTDKGRVARHIKPLLGKKKAKDVTRADVQRFLNDVAAGKTACDEKTGTRGRAIVEGGKGAATRTVGLLGGIFSFAVDRGIRSDNPVHGVKRFRDRKAERFLSSKELSNLGLGLSVMEDLGVISSVMAGAVRLLLLTSCRKTEVLSLKWSYVDFERGYLRLPDSKTGEKAVPLGAAALEVLTGLPRLSDEWVFPATTRGIKEEDKDQSKRGHMVGLPRAWEAVREWCGIEDVRLHDLRHSFASVGAAGGDSLLVIGSLLGHHDTQTTARYAHLSNDPVKRAADRISGSIAATMSGNPSAEVVELPKRKA